VDSITSTPILNAIVTVVDLSDSTAQTNGDNGVDTVASLGGRGANLGRDAGTYRISITSPGYVGWSKEIAVTAATAEACPAYVQVVAKMSQAR
jgi:hypothetical protein